MYQHLYRSCTTLNKEDQLLIALRLHIYLTHLPHLIKENILVARCNRYNMIHSQLSEYTSLNLNLLHILLPLNLGTCLQLLLGIDAQLTKQVDARLIEVTIEHKRCRCFTIKTSALRLLAPLVRVAVTIEANSLTLTNQLTQTLIYSLLLLHALGNALIHTLAEIDKRLCDSGIENNHCIGTVVRRTNCTELEAITRKGKRRCSVTIGIIQKERRNLCQTAHAEYIL